MKKSEAVKIVREVMQLDDEKKLDEAYVASAKTFDMPTELVSEKTKRAHLALYGSVVQTLNNISAELDAVDVKTAHKDSSAFRALKIDEQHALNAVWLHELYFANCSDVHSEVMMDSLSFMRLERDFGSFDAWQLNLIACAKSARSGWVVTGYHMFLRRYVNVVIDGDDLSVPIGIYPVVVIDMNEHARIDYLNDIDTYVTGQMRELNWQVIENRFIRGERIAEALK